MKVIEGRQISDFLIHNNVDSLIVSASFEDRCFSLIGNVKERQFTDFIIFRNIDFDQSVVSNSEKMFEDSRAINKKFTDLFINDPVKTFLAVHDTVVNLFAGKSKNLLIDITTFTHEGLLILLLLTNKHRRSDDNIYFCYNCAIDYSINESVVEDKWLTKGIKDIRSIIGYPGYFDPSKKNHLIILFGFESERTIKLIEKFDYDFVSLAFASLEKSIGANHQEINSSRHKEILSLYSNFMEFTISLKDPVETKNELIEYISKFEDHNIVIAPMNNKISTIGAGLAAIENTNIQLCYLQANQYNVDGYSVASDKFYFWDYSSDTA